MRHRNATAPRVPVEPGNTPVGLSGAELLNGEDASIFLELRNHLMAKAAEARTSVFNFFDFVMREENTRKHVKIAPHQRVGLEFILAHERSVNMWPVGHAKTFTLAALTLFLLGSNPTTRGAIVSSTQEQASKPLGMVRDYIETSPELKLVFPNLAPSTRKGDPWTQTEITVERPPGIRDASLIAVGVDGAIAGARLNWIIVDDILDRENTATKEQRQKVYEWFDSSVLSRLDPRNARIVVVNTAWHPEDLVHMLKKLGWATMRMDIYGNIEVQDDVERTERGEEAWDSPLLRPASIAKDDPECRLTPHDPDDQNVMALWPERIRRDDDDVTGQRGIDFLKKRHLPHRFNQLYRNICRDDDTARCKSEWIEACKKKARELGYFGMIQKYDGGNLTFTGVDLAVGIGEEHDDVAFFTFEVLPNKLRRILDVDVGQFNGPTIITKLIDKAERYNSIVRVENNAAQDFIRQFALERNAALPVKPHTTGRAKAHPEHGVEGLFIEIYNAAWIIPNDKRGFCHPFVQRWIDACLYYDPAKHTDDVLMASYFAREQAKEWGVLTGSDTANLTEGIGAAIMSR